MDISEDGHYIAACYERGLLVLWDGVKFKLAHVMKDVAENEKSKFT
jgi:hypothetical protein